VSDILVASSCLDGDGLERVSEQLAALPNSRLWASTAAACNAAVHLARGQLAEGTAIIHRALSGTGEWGFLGIIRGFAIGVHADLLLAANAAGEALSLLEDVSSPIGHSLCFDVQRSSAYIMLGRPHDVLKATDACVESGIEHCLRTLPPILLRRAVAFDLLGLSAAADVSFREAILLIKESGSVIGFMNLPQRNVALLVDRLVDHHPEYRAELAAILQQTNGLPTPADKAVDLSLTSRELTVAAMLRSGADPIQIASELFISTNTVKVHLRNVYHKLGVHSRTDALAKIEAVGLYTLEGRR
jgi:DNA-binding CsgD family transcriptional regulator